MKKLIKLRNWIIHKLGGITFDDVASEVGAVKDYWAHECLHTSIYVEPAYCNDEYAKNIEFEIACRIAEVMLDEGHMGFTYRRNVDGDFEIYGQAHILKVKHPAPYHMPSHLKFDK